MMLTSQITPTETQIAQLKKNPKNKPIVMLNILKFKKYSTTNETEQEASVTHFLNMIAVSEYQKIVTNRSIALEYGGLIACKTTL